MGSARHEFFISINSDWDGYIIPHIQNDSPSDKVFATARAGQKSFFRRGRTRVKHVDDRVHPFKIS